MAAPVGIGVAAGIGLAVGFGIGYFVAKARWADHYDKLAQEEIDEARAYYIRAKEEAEKRVKAPLVEAIEYLGYVKAEDAVAEPGSSDPGESEEAVAGDGTEVSEPVVVGENQVAIPPPTIGPRTGDVWDYATELAHRAENPGRPYIIHVDEYGEEADEGFDTTCYSYYEDDEILADERDEVIDNVDELVGLDNLQKFGHGTDNLDALLVRNESLRLDIEILKTKGSYAEEVQGFLQHNYSVEKMPRRQERFDDDRPTG